MTLRWAKSLASWRETTESELRRESKRCTAGILMVAGRTKFIKDWGEFPPRPTQEPAPRERG